MCGINGIIDFSRSLNNKGELIQKMNQSIAHRGPDYSGVFQDEIIALGHTRLSIIDLSDAAHQPMKSHDQRYQIVFNGEIYNFEKIKSQLRYPFKTHSDTEVLLAAYMHYGQEVVQHLEGMFAFAIYDQTEKTIFLARDRSGIKPLYFYNTKNHFVFSSETRGLFASEMVTRKIPQESLVDYLRYQTTQTPATLFEGVEMLPPGHSILVTEDQIKIDCYHKWEYNPSLRAHSREEQVQKVKSLVEEAIEKRLVADVPMGSFLSGGIDSSITSIVASQKLSEPLNTFSVVFDEAEFSERPYIQKVVDQYKTKHHYIELKAQDFLDEIPNALVAMDHPSGDGPNTYVISKATKNAGITMALSGLGGDEVFGGYPIFSQAPALMQKKWLLSFPKGIRKLMGSFNKLKEGNSIAAQKKKALLELDLFDAEYIYQYSRQIFLDPTIKQLLKQSSLPENRVLRHTNNYIGYEKEGFAFPTMSKISIAEMETYMQNTLLRDTDQMSMAHALEIRVPFLDHHLVEYVLQIQDQFKVGQYPKNLLVEAFQQELPREVYDRKKMGFVLPYEHWMKNELASFCKENLQSLERHPSFNMNKVNALWNDFSQSDKISWSRIWGLVVLGAKLEEWDYE